MNTIKEELVECVCGDFYPVEEVRQIYHGGYIHEENLEDYVQLNSACGEPEHGSNGLWLHIDEVITVDCDGTCFPEDNFQEYDVDWDHAHDSYAYIDNMVYGYVGRNEEGYFHNESDYCYSERDNVYFIDSDMVERCDYEYCESQDDYVHVDDVENNDEEWDNTGRNIDLRFDKTFGMPYTFGVEIETSDGYLDYQSDLNLKAVYDGSINGKEYVTGCMSGNQGVDMLQKICERISDVCYVDSSCGVHVHIGGANFNRRFSILSIMLGVMLEKEIFSMLPKSRQKSSYCLFIPNKFYELRTVNKRLYPRTHKKMLQLLAEYINIEGSEFNRTNNKKLAHPGGRYSSSRYKWLNLNNCSYTTGPNTIEFRCHSASKDFTKIYNWLLICMCFVKYVENNSRQIIDSYNKWISTPHGFKGDEVTLRDIVSEGLGKDANVLLEYINIRKEKFAD